MAQFQLINREWSWLDFNARVLEEAQDASNPLLERLKFIAITSNNLDEFFMVRVGSLHLMKSQGYTKPCPAGWPLTEQLDRIGAKAHELVEAQYRCYSSDLEPALTAHGIRRLRPEEATAAQTEHLQRLFTSELYPLLTPAVVDPDVPQPLYANLRMHLLIRLKESTEGAARPQARNLILPVMGDLDRFIPLASEAGYTYILLEDVLRMFIGQFFPGDSVLECVPFRVTRNADMPIDENDAPDLAAEMSEILSARKVSDPVRLELHNSATRIAERFLLKLFGVSERELYRVDGPLNFADYFALVGLPAYETLRVPEWKPCRYPALDLSKSLFPQIAAKSRLLHHPYQTFDPVVNLIEEAADDARVLAIKQILYRTSKNSPIVAALMRAARNGKTVTAIVELKARFDEARNIGWARAMEQAGVQVIYGVKGLKTHAKLLIIVRREPEGIRRYLHVGTGNYNEGTARVYTDVSYLTADPTLGADASQFFNTITGFSQPGSFRRLAASPLTIRSTLMELIEGEAERARQGQKGHIMAKFNSLADPGIIEALYQASRAGVTIELNVRGVCCLVPGVPGMSENIRVVSVVDRFLEHSRIFYFRHGGDERIFISSADWMPRNLDKRVELMTPVDEGEHRNTLKQILRAGLDDNVKARELGPDMRYTRVSPRKRGTALRSQEKLYRDAKETETAATRTKRTTFQPHRPT